MIVTIRLQLEIHCTGYSVRRLPDLHNVRWSRQAARTDYCSVLSNGAFACCPAALNSVHARSVDSEDLQECELFAHRIKAYLTEHSAARIVLRGRGMLWVL